jgi:hypothetical protein
MNGHNVITACFAYGEIGKNPAAIVATRIAMNFPSLKFGLMVSVGGDVPIPAFTMLVSNRDVA